MDRRVAFGTVGELPPYWHPKTEAEIEQAIRNDCLRETHYLDCKREISAPAHRKETARDLASFAIDGGALLIGVEEDKVAQTFTLAPQPLNGLAERIEDIAWSAIDPGLDVVPHVVKSVKDDALGYVFVEVRPSHAAPHMVDGIYYGRGEKKRVRLSDAQVRRYHAQRASAEGEVGRLLDDEIARDPVPADVGKLGHLYLVAVPVTAPRTIARSLIRQPNGMRLKEIARAAEPRLASGLDRYQPSVILADRVTPRAQGTALCSRSASGPGRTFRSDSSTAEESLVDIEFREDGSIWALVGKATWAYRDSDTRRDLEICEPVIIAYAIRLTGWAASMGDAIGYRGSWYLGLHASEIRNLPGQLADGDARFDADYYRAITTASHADLTDGWQRIVGELVGRLMYALGTPLSMFGGLMTV